MFKLRKLGWNFEGFISFERQKSSLGVSIKDMFMSNCAQISSKDRVLYRLNRITRVSYKL